MPQAATQSLGSAVAAILLFSSCSQQAPTPKAAPGQAAAVPVLVARAELRNIPVQIRAIGNVQPCSTVSIRSQITGPIVDVHFQEGQEVREGDLLLTIDPRPYESAINQSRSTLIRDEAQLVSARLDFQRTSNLFVSKIASQQDYDTAEASYHAWQGTVLADQAAITNAQINLGYTRILAPIDGRTSSLAVKKGNVVKAPDDVLMNITQMHPIYVAFSIPEQNLPSIRQESAQSALAVQAVIPSQPELPATGELTFINNTVDTNTGTILLKATFTNTNNFLWPGQFVQVSLTLSNLVDAVVVPSQAVQTGQNGEFIFVVKPDFTVDPRPVSVGIPYENWTVITSGLGRNDLVVTDGQLRLTPGAKVSFKVAEGSSSALSSAGQPR